MNYLLVENRSIVHLNMPWRQRYFQTELDDHGITFTVPVTEGYIKINDNFEFMPVTKETIPSYDPLFEHLIGPYYTFYDTFAEAGYAKEDNDIESVKLEIKNRIAAERYKRENAGTITTVQGIQVKVDTARDVRNIFIQKLLMMGDTEVTNWKFDEGWLSLSKSELLYIIQQGASYIQSQFDWEKELVLEVNNCLTIPDLKSLYLTIFPPVTERDIHAI